MTLDPTSIQSLEALAETLDKAPIVIGSMSVAVAGPGSRGTVIGSQSIAIGRPGFSGAVIGSQSVAMAGGPSVTKDMAAELRAAVADLRSGKQVEKSRLQAVIDRAKILINKGIDAGVVAAAEKAVGAIAG